MLFKREWREMNVAETSDLIYVNNRTRQKASFMKRRRVNRCDGHEPIESRGARR
jgi:hypothetical protein